MTLAVVLSYLEKIGVVRERVEKVTREVQHSGVMILKHNYTYYRLNGKVYKLECYVMADHTYLFAIPEIPWSLSSSSDEEEIRVELEQSLKTISELTDDDVFNIREIILYLISFATG